MDYCACRCCPDCKHCVWVNGEKKMNYSDRVTHKMKPYQHQIDAINNGCAALEKTGFFYINADMGTGKSKISLNIAEIMTSEYVFIVCPKALIGTWKTALADHYGKPYACLVWSEAKASTRKYHAQFMYWKNSQSKKFIIMNVETFSTKRPMIENLIAELKPASSLCVIDESSKIKSPDAARTKRIITTFAKFKYKICLTGTPIGNSILDLYTQYEFLKPGFWGFRNYYGFRARYAIMVEQYGPGGRSFKKVVGVQKVNEVMDRIKPHTFFALKKDCLDLPEKIRQTIMLDPPPELLALYHKLKETLMIEYKDKELTLTNVVSLFIRFRQLTGHNFPILDPELGPMGSEPIPDNRKLEFILADSEDYEGKVIIWAAFVAEIKAIRNSLGDECVSFYGDTSEAEREAALVRFKTDPSVKYFVANPASAAYGLNLQFSSLTYWYSRTLSSEQNCQAEDRQHRIGQKDNVVYKELLYKGTIDERVAEIIAAKRNMLELFQTGKLSDAFNLI
jgi:SNF2 family DNA or RNA helicase